MNRRARRLLVGWGLVIVLAVVSSVAILASRASDNETPPTAVGPTTSEHSPPTSGTANNGQPGFGTPVVDVLGRQVTVPNNPVGAPLEQTGTREPSTCDATGPIPSPSGVQIQQTIGLPTLVSTTDGPTRINGSVLTGYARTPQGAALAGWNWLGRAYGPGAAAQDAFVKLTVHTDELERQLDGETWDGMGLDGAVFPAPVGFRIVSCTNSFASVEYAIEIPVDDNGMRRAAPVWTVLRTSMFYDGTEWRSRLDRRSLSLTDGVTDVSGFTRWSFS